MNSIKEECIKITFMGSAFVGKTSIINQLINKKFISKYEPTMKVEDYCYRMNLNDDEICKPLYVKVIIQDTFGINNPILNKSPDIIESKRVIHIRNEMTNQFKELMFTAHEIRNKLCEEENKSFLKIPKNKNPYPFVYDIDKMAKEIERKGFVFVCDCSDAKSISNMIKIIDKQLEIEKTTNVSIHKIILFNKSDKIVNEKEFKAMMKKYKGVLEKYKKKNKIDSYRVSSLTNSGISSAIKKFISKIHQEIKYTSLNEEIDDPEDDIDLKLFHPLCSDKLNSCSKQICCGAKLFMCTEGNNSD